MIGHTPLAADDRARGHTSFDGAIDTRLIISRDADELTGNRRRLLELVQSGSNGEGVRFTTLHRDSGLSKSSCSHALKWLVASGYLRRARGRYLITESGTHALGPTGPA